MAQTLEYNTVVKDVASVMIPTFDEDVGHIQKLDDEPNDVGGLSADELKRRFDLGAAQIQQYLNETLIPAVVADGLTEQSRQLAESERVKNEQERVANEARRQNSLNSVLLLIDTLRTEIAAIDARLKVLEGGGSGPVVPEGGYTEVTSFVIEETEMESFDAGPGYFIHTNGELCPTGSIISFAGDESAEKYTVTDCHAYDFGRGGEYRVYFSGTYTPGNGDTVTVWQKTA